MFKNFNKQQNISKKHIFTQNNTKTNAPVNNVSKIRVSRFNLSSQYVILKLEL